MRTRSSSHLIFTIWSVLALALIVAGCVPPATQPPAATAKTAAPAPTEIPKPAPAPCLPLLPVDASTAVFEADASKCFVENQVLVTGLKSFFESKPDVLTPLTPLQTIDLTQLVKDARERDKGFKVPHFPPFEKSDEGLQSILFVMPAENKGAVADFIAKFDADPKTIGANGEVLARADPNYLMHVPTIEGFPNGVVGSPYADAASAPNAFATQWAFSQIGVIPASSGLLGGGGIPIGIFDTIPLPMTPENVSDYAFQAPSSTTDKGSLTLCMKNPMSNAKITSVGSTSIADHGVFAAYLAQAVAPDSDITLYRVLNEFGDGDLATLSRSLRDFISTTGGVGPGVINLSLGVHWYPESRWPEAACGDWISNFEINEGLDVTLASAYHLGFVVVAAAGNGANNAATPPTVMPPNYPASSGAAIGVAASNSDDELACFSNSGPNLILAPGGDGRVVGQNKCEKPLQDCTNNPILCKNEGIISLMPSSPTGYGYWTGTSFAAPLVSGLAARCLADNKTRFQSLQVSQVATKVWQAIQDGAKVISTTDPQKLIDVPDTLGLCGK